MMSHAAKAREQERKARARLRVLHHYVVGAIAIVRRGCQAFTTGLAAFASIPSRPRHRLFARVLRVYAHNSIRSATDFVDARPGIVKNSAGWMHIGANIGAATDPANTVHASDDAFEARLTTEMAPPGLSVDRRVPGGTVPGGEDEVVHRGGGHYVSVIGRNALCHNPE